MDEELKLLQKDMEDCKCRECDEYCQDCRYFRARIAELTGNAWQVDSILNP